MAPIFPGHTVEAVLRPGRTFLFRHAATGARVVVKRLASARPERRLRSLAPLAGRWQLVALDGVTHLVRPFVEGRSLEEALRERGAVDALAVARGLALALAPLHARGVAHGELHPGNVLLGPAGAVELVDGLEPFRGAAEPGDARSALEAGHAAPEVIRGASPGVRADVWSLGAMLHAMLAGAAPLGAGDPAETARRILYGAPVRLGLVRPELPGAVTGAVDRSLRRRPGARWRDAIAMIDAIDGGATAAFEHEHEPGASLAASGGTVAPARRSRGGRAVIELVRRLGSPLWLKRAAIAAVPALLAGVLWIGGEDPVAREVHARIAAGELAAARAVLDAAAAQRPGDVRLEKLRGDLACARGAAGECLRRYRAAVEARPALANDPVLRDNVLTLLAREEDRGLSIRLASRLDGVDTALLERTRSDRYWTRWNAVRALEARGEAERIDYAEVYAKDLLGGGSCATRRAAATKLAELRDPRTLPALEEARDRAGAFGFFCTGDAIGRAIAAVKGADGG